MVHGAILGENTQMSKFKKTFAFLVLYSTLSFIIFFIMVANKAGLVGWLDLAFSYLLVGAVIVVAFIWVWAMEILL